MIEIVEAIAKEEHPGTTQEFFALLDITENNTQLWAAIHTLEKLKVEPETEHKALENIRKAAEGDCTEAMGYKMWLREYENGKS